MTQHLPSQGLSPRYLDDDDERETPPVVTAAVSIGTAPIPFLAVYAALFILHGWLRPVHPPDVTSSQTGELIAGIVALVALVLICFTLVWFSHGARRWPFALGQLAVLATTVAFLLDPTTGGAAVSVLLLLTSVVSLALGAAPDAWRHVGRRVPTPVERVYGLHRRGLGGGRVATAGDTAALPRSTPTSRPTPRLLRRRRPDGPDGPGADA